MGEPNHSVFGIDRHAGVLLPVLDFLRRHAPFDRMEPEHLAFLARRLKLTFYGQGEKLTDPEGGAASRFYIIKQGRVRGETPSEDEQVSGNAWELVPGECFPIGALLSLRPVRTVHRAAVDTFCFELERDDFNRLIQISPAFHDFCTRRLACLLDQMHRHVQASATTGPGADTSLNITLGECLRREPVTCLATTPIREVLRSMERENVGSIAVVDEHMCPLGMFTLRDLLSRVALVGRSTDEPVGGVMSPEPLTLPPSAFAFEAALLMTHRGFHHVCVVEQGLLKGVISERDLFSLQRVGLGNLSRSIARAADVSTLAALGSDIQQLITQMIAQGAQVEQITQIISRLNDHITRRIMDLCARDFPPLPVPFTWLAFGGEGRREQTLQGEQDNGIVFQAPEGVCPDQIREALLPLAKRINEALGQCGYPLCPHHILAGNPDWCLSTGEWRERFARWVGEGTAECLRRASTFFDFRAVEGRARPVEELRGWLMGKVGGAPSFLRRMASNALLSRPPLGLVRGGADPSDAAPPDTLDLKAHGLTPFVDGARVLALAHGIGEVSTLERIDALARDGHVAPDEAQVWKQAFSYVQLLRVRHQRTQKARGEQTSNGVDLEALSPLDRRILKEAFRQARKLQARVALEFPP